MAIDFPNSPTVGQDYGEWQWDGAKWVSGPSSGPFVPLSGGTMTGPLVLSGNATASLNPVALQQLQAGYLPLSGGTINGALSVTGNFSASGGTFNGNLTAPTSTLGGVTFGGSSNMTMNGTLSGNVISCSGAISSNGNISAGNTLVTNLGVSYRSYSNANQMAFNWGSNVYAIVDGAGQGNLAWASCDAERKRDFAPLEVDCLAAVNRIALQQFNWEPFLNMHGEAIGQLPHWSCGYTAQQVREIIPEAVLDAPEGQPLGVDLRCLCAHLIGAVHQLTDRIAALEAKAG